MDQEQEDKIANLLVTAKAKSEQNAREVREQEQEQEQEEEEEVTESQHSVNSTLAIMIYGLNKHATGKELESFLKKQQQQGVLDSAFTYRKLKKAPGVAGATMSFDKVEDQKLAMKLLEGLGYKKSSLHCEEKRHQARGGMKRDRDQCDGGGGREGGRGGGKKSRLSGDEEGKDGTPKSARTAVAAW